MTPAVLRRLSVVNLCLLVGNDCHASIIELHPLALALDNGVVVTELQALPLMDHNALQVIHFGSALDVFDAELLGERNPKIKFLLHERLRVNPEALEVNE